MDAIIGQDAIGEDVTARLAEHIRNNTTDMAAEDLRVPVSHFASDAHAQAEIAMFRRLPLFVALGSEVAKAGDFVTRDVLGTPVIIVREDDGQVAAFMNICRHRGARIEHDATGNKRVFTCKYHGWSYERCGDLRHVPFESSFGSIDRDQSGLFPIKVEERHGLIWLDLSNGLGGSVEAFLGPPEEARLAALGFDKTVIYLEKTFDLDVNWKLVVDCAVDSLHAPFLHPGGVDNLVTTNLNVWNDYGRHGQLFNARRKFVDVVKSGGPVAGDFKSFSSAMMVFPNNVLIAMPDHFECWSVWPTETAAKCQVKIRFLVRPEIADDRIKGRMDRSWEILAQAAINEDFPIEATIQANAKANPNQTYLYGRSEVAPQHLHRNLAREMAKTSAANER